MNPLILSFGASLNSLLGRAALVQMVRNLPANSGDVVSIPGLRRSPGEGNGYPLHYSCLKNSMDRGAWRATVHGVPKSQTMIKRLTFSQFEHLIDAYILKVMSFMSMP